jgi:hypothetical protein
MTIPSIPATSSVANMPEVLVQQGYGLAALPGKSAKLQIKMDDGIVLPLWVIDTDYISWAVLYSCAMQLGSVASDQVFFVMSRTHSLDPMDVGDRLNQLSALGLPWKNVAFAPVYHCSAM